ncbi:MULTISPECIES: GAP family protein [Actinomadura]|uniref:GAP family protein n=1 Tax=Actinomadura yumaensis TaxID=111807 RepID=A0ABW2CS14_9ACTN|nr:GAP family protein [Actinomadura sp. J1-007]
MTPALALVLAGLALVDSTSFGTLLIPVWLLLAPGRLRPGRIAAYLAVVAAFYFCAGALLALGAEPVLNAARTAAAAVPPSVLKSGQLALGIAIIALSYRLEARARRREGAEGRVQRWRAQTMSGSGGTGALMSLALLAALLEAATMLPYLAAVGLIADADLGWRLTGATLAAYCLVMTLPAAVLAVVRLTAHRMVEPPLRRINDWLTRNTPRALGWTVGGIGISVTLNAAAGLLLEH